MTLDIEIICIGNELLIGKVKDLNAHYLAKQTTQLGVNIKRAAPFIVINGKLPIYQSSFI